MNRESGPGVHNNRIVYFVDTSDAETEAATALFHSLGIVSRRVPGGIAGLETLRDREPGCLVVDIDTVGRDLASVFDALPPDRTGLPVVVISAHAESAAIVDVMRLGACDFLTKPLDRDALAASMGRVFDRLDNEIEAYKRRQIANSRIGALTERERDILKGLLAGSANKTLAHDLGISIRTVEMHRSHLMARLGVHSLVEVIRLSFDAGIELEPTPSGLAADAGAAESDMTDQHYCRG